ncbi:MAG: lipopolysaccharide biosynthesis protein [Caulobacterales bacterium 32-67-6]|nr:MAG: lipopolysaccharide biosynthesis protein [Caulobacterales bacterium 32-67-6]
MAATSAWTVRSYDAAPRSEWVARPRYAPSDFIVLLWRERFLMLAVFAILFVIGAALALTLKTTYPASSSILVRLGQEYVYEPRAGDAGRGAVPDSDQVIQSETEIIGSTELKQRVIDRLGLMRIYPELAKKFAEASAAEKRVIMGQAIRGMETSLKIQTAPDTPIVRLVFTHEDPKTAALVLNTLLEEYLIFRRTVLVEANGPAMALQRQAFETRLEEADAAYEAFLTSNRIADFVAEKAALSQLQSQIEQQKYLTEAQLQDRSGRLAALQAQMGQVEPEVGLYRDVNNAASDKLITLKLQREDLLGRYRADAQPVRELDAQIARLEAGIAEGRTTGDQLQAEVAALRQSLEALNAQMGQLLERRLKLAELEPRFQALSLDRDVLQANVRDFAVREEQNRAAREIAAASNDNIRIVQRATPPARGSSLKKPVLVLAFLFAGFTALCAGLLRMFLRPGLPTPASASRTLDLPVLGVAPLKAS